MVAATLVVAGGCGTARGSDGLRLVTFDHATFPATAGDGRRSTGPLGADEGMLGVLLAISAAALLGFGAGGAAWRRRRVPVAAARSVTDAPARGVQGDVQRDLEALLLDRDASLLAMGATLREVEATLREAEAACRRAEAEATRAERVKGDFLAVVSHEIRTPLAAILGFSDLLLGDPDLSASSRRNAERIRGGGAALLSVVNDILDVAQADAGALRAGVLGDDARLRQILLNLLNNAVKFTPVGSVSLRIGPEAPGGRVRFAVSDTGIGIDAADLPILFQRFRQVDGTMRRAHGGTGLGLAICKALVELMGGAIGVTSTKGVGSTFWFAVDLPAAPLTHRGWPEPAGTPPRALDVLLVEDLEINQELVRAVVEAKGHRVDVVCDGADAIMAAADKGYDLVLMDLQMPYVDGLSATRAIRASPHPCRAVPIVALSANVRADRTAAAMAAGMDGWLGKPLDFDALDAVLAAAAAGTLRAGMAGADGGVRAA